MNGRSRRSDFGRYAVAYTRSKLFFTTTSNASIRLLLREPASLQVG